jgi:hypothetical protein
MGRNYQYLFPTILEAKVHQLLEFARRGGGDRPFKEFSGRLKSASV